MAKDVTAVILAGGRSRRLGADKATLEISGKTLLEHVIEKAAPLVDDLVVVGPWAPSGVARTLESPRYAGPLAALAAGFAETRRPHVLALACDHPLLAENLLEALLGMRHEGEAVVPYTPTPDGLRAEPLVSVFARACEPIAESLLGRGSMGMHALLDEVARTARIVRVEPEVWGLYDADGASFLDVDEAADAAEVTRRFSPRLDRP